MAQDDAVENGIQSLLAKNSGLIKKLEVDGVNANSADSYAVNASDVKSLSTSASSSASSSVSASASASASASKSASNAKKHPAKPSNPSQPVNPDTPVTPVNPDVPNTPSDNGGNVSPVSPFEPVAPITPVNPVTPVTPVQPNIVIPNDNNINGNNNGNNVAPATPSKPHKKNVKKQISRIKNFNYLGQLKNNETAYVGKSKNVKFTRINIHNMPPYIMAVKHILLHKNSNFKGSAKSVKLGKVLPVKKAFTETYKKHGRKIVLTRYEVKVGKRSYFISGYGKFTTSAYLTKSNFKRGHKAIRVIKNCQLYRHGHAVRGIKKGTKLSVKHVVKIGHITRLQLTNGRYITGNKNYVKVVK